MYLYANIVCIIYEPFDVHRQQVYIVVSSMLLDQHIYLLLAWLLELPVSRCMPAVLPVIDRLGC